MNTEQTVKRDERTVAVENAAFKWGYYIFYIGTLVRLPLPAQGSERGYWGSSRGARRKCSRRHCVSDQTQGRGTAVAAEKVLYCLDGCDLPSSILVIAYLMLGRILSRRLDKRVEELFYLEEKP